MEQRRFSGKGHWYHETQSNHSQSDVLPLVPEAANVDDRFLLDLALPDAIALAAQGWLAPARALCHQLFPLDTPVNRLRTLSAYDRLSTALTVAQACGVQRLCNHYAALLAPLPGPDSSRESNRRLAQITQYARQLASSPDVIGDKALLQLDEVGLTVHDIVLINQIIGFIGFQARTVAVFQAALGHPVRWLPGHHISPHTVPAHIQVWVSLLPAVELRYASPEQRRSLARWQAETALGPLVTVLCHEPALLDRLGDILTTLPDQAEPDFPALTKAVALLNSSPDRFSAAHLTALGESGLPHSVTLNLLIRSAFYGWLDRLRIALGQEE